jgi:hypothetical protein
MVNALNVHTNNGKYLFHFRRPLKTYRSKKSFHTCAPSVSEIGRTLKNAKVKDTTAVV